MTVLQSLVGKELRGVHNEIHTTEKALLSLNGGRRRFGWMCVHQGRWDKVCAHVVQLKFHRDSAQ